MKSILSLLPYFCLLLHFSVSAQDKNSTAPFKTIKMACVGNSITAGVGASDREKKGYVGILTEMLGEGYDVRNFGVSGATACREHTNPTLIFLHLRRRKNFNRIS